MKPACSGRIGWKYPASTYRKHAVKHAAQGVVLFIAATGALWALSVGVAVACLLVGEIVLLAVLPRAGWFRDDVEKRLEEQAREDATTLRRALVSRMTDDHRRELERLERLALQIRERCKRGTTERERRQEDETIDAFLGLSRMFAVFTRLAIAHRTNAESFTTVHRSELEEHASRLEALLQEKWAAKHPWISRRLEIARQRIETWDRASNSREAMAHKMAMIGELVRFLYEKTGSWSMDRLDSEIDDVLLTWEQTGSALEDLSLLCQTCDPADVHVFEVCGRARADTGPMALPGVPAQTALVAGPPPTIPMAPRELAPRASVVP